MRKVTGRQRGRVFAYDRYLVLLSEGTEAVRAGLIDTSAAAREPDRELAYRDRLTSSSFAPVPASLTET